MTSLDMTPYLILYIKLFTESCFWKVSMRMNLNYPPDNVFCLITHHRNTVSRWNFPWIKVPEVYFSTAFPLWRNEMFAIPTGWLTTTKFSINSFIIEKSFSALVGIVFVARPLPDRLKRSNSPLFPCSAKLMENFATTIDWIASMFSEKALEGCFLTSQKYLLMNSADRFGSNKPRELERDVILLRKSLFLHFWPKIRFSFALSKNFFTANVFKVEECPKMRA